MSILARYNAHVLDIGQADIHSTLSLGILIRIDEKGAGQVMKELLFKATELGVNIGLLQYLMMNMRIGLVDKVRIDIILTIIGRSLSARNIEERLA